MNKKTIEDIVVSGKKVLVRCDFNVPFDSEGNISDPKRIILATLADTVRFSQKEKDFLCMELQFDNVVEEK